MERRTVYLIDYDPWNEQFRWLLGSLRDLAPDCITLEASMEAARDLHKAFKEPISGRDRTPEIANTHLWGFASGIYYAREAKKPVYMLGEVDPYKSALVCDMLQYNNFEVLASEGFGHLELSKTPTQDVAIQDRSLHDRLVGFGINYRLYFGDGCKSVAHISVDERYSGPRCVPLQDIVASEGMIHIDATRMMQERYR